MAASRALEPSWRCYSHINRNSLSARHDGENNLCNASERYIMGSPDAEKKPGTEYNPWLFSPCSVSYFTSFLKKKLSSSRGYTCLVYAVEASADIPDVSDKLLGQASESRRSITEICQAMLCADVSRGLCIPQIALIGTSCGDGKVCINGQCVSDPYAPQLDENCAFGDRPSYSCSLFINDFMGNCYSTLGYRACCDTCNNVSRPVKGCEYGDRIIDCTKDHCLNSQVDCCGTCNYGTPFTPTYSTRRSTPKRLTTTVNPLVLFTSIKDCKPGDQDLRPELCTNFSVCLIQPTQCCHYCSSYYTSATTSTTTTRPLIPSTSPKTKCEPGDLDLRPELCTNTSVCQTKSSLCCHYCSLHYKSATTSTTQLTSPNECVLGEPDLSPQLCTSRSICQTQPLMCCNNLSTLFPHIDSFIMQLASNIPEKL
ncbi:A disintegrin and metalloproteinase with thrombospondin motifs 7 [Biomphalaria glabrata]|nr:A disintegrin and metalloproteinase with thrombospondin motifs 7 [Biomphalaria glabrata]